MLSLDELRWFWFACDEVGWPFGPIGQLLLLTAQRRSEVGEMDWSEIDMANEVWTIPGPRTKNGREHKVHLAKVTRGILDGLEPRKRGLVFSTTGDHSVSGYSRGKDRIAQAMLRIRRRELGQPEADHDLRKFLKIRLRNRFRLRFVPGCFTICAAVLRHTWPAGISRSLLTSWTRFSITPAA